MAAAKSRYGLPLAGTHPERSKQVHGLRVRLGNHQGKLRAHMAAAVTFPNIAGPSLTTLAVGHCDRDGLGGRMVPRRVGRHRGNRIDTAVT